MSDILAIGDMVHIASRRRFSADTHVHFAGEVTAVEPPLFRVVGYLFVYEPVSNTYFKHADLRTRLFTVADSARDITLLPRKVEKTLIRMSRAASARREGVLAGGGDFGGEG